MKRANGVAGHHGQTCSSAEIRSLRHVSESDQQPDDTEWLWRPPMMNSGLLRRPSRAMNDSVVDWRFLSFLIDEADEVKNNGLDLQA
ncbi:hypothetical protein LJ656_19240 [Paraburkholderia sp. MMS20-SJTR3]|uniref:Uncharacterized protein n=1 Tax=Paraburkholderia sejongensis TaxID=2886946 RepID=A0ABS8JXV0_9BURK|nr:hypothetical protein [Paraburkholderia sp. MMS20-SJTR3]MCC8394732.1 hypothetical protein [Paraburkholderia sp. MMS20-SJTR3]